MTGNEPSDRSGTVRPGSDHPAEKTDGARSVPVLCAYDAVKGTDSFVVAAADREDAWIAVEEGGERSLERWR